jgi:hypothetical protein
LRVAHVNPDHLGAEYLVEQHRRVQPEAAQAEDGDRRAPLHVRRGDSA